jgi:F0F1-type ATP synthase assembly protein I
MPDVPTPEPSDAKKEKNLLVQAARYTEMGFIIPAAAFAGLLLGKLFDHWLGTHWIYIAGVVLGIIAGFVQMIRMAMAASNDQS